MKKIGIIGLILLLLSGCSKKEEKLNVSEWMFGEHLSETTARSILGAPSDVETTETCVIYSWSDYEIYPGYKGTLSYQDYYEEDEFLGDRWVWDAACDEKTYEKISGNMKKQLGGPTHQAKDGLSENFSAEKLSFDESINDDKNFSCAYKEGIITIAWCRNGFF